MPCRTASQTTLCRQGRERLTLQTEGWSFWQWKGHRCHYISAGEDNNGPIVVLVHGFGAHSYHWRYTVPALARQGEGANEMTATTRRAVCDDFFVLLLVLSSRFGGPSYVCCGAVLS